MNFDEIFPQTLLINLESRTDRLEEATRELGREAVLWERLPAVDAAEVKRPRGYDRPGAYALALRIRLTLRRALREGWETVFFFEDDVVLADGLHGKLAQVQLPEDWDFFYLGCVHCHPAVVLAPNLVRSLGATSSHAFGVNRKAFRQLLQALRPATGSMPREPVAIDQVLCRLHRETRAYACFPNLAWQRDGYSDLEGKHFSSFSPDGTPWQWRECLADAQAAWLAAEYEKAVALENEPEATATPLEGLRLYLGCQGRPDHGWIAQDLPHLRVSKRLPFHDRTVAAIVMDEVVRHLSPEEAVILFDECQRILKPGGMLRLTFAVLKGLWQTLDTAVMKKERTEKLHDGTVRGAVSALASAHTTLWHPEDLLLLLTSRGYFAEQCRPGESAIPSFQAVPHPCCQGHLAGIEATKPPDGSGSIPRIFHAIWLGPKPMPPQQAAWMEGWKAAHPHWEFILWTDENLPLFQCPHKFNESVNWAQKSDILRYEVLYRYGGVYLDTDMECLLPLDGLIAGLSGFIGHELPGRPGTAIMGATPGHSLLRQWLDDVSRSGPFVGANTTEAGPDFTGGVLKRWQSHNTVFLMLEDGPAEQESGILCRDRFAIFHPWVFYPYWMNSPWNREDHPHAYAAHHWAASWH